MIIIGSDHAGVELKEKIINYLFQKNFEYIDVNNENQSSEDDYPDVAQSICEKVIENSNNLGIAICGTGIGMSIAANKNKGIRAAVCTDEYMAKMARMHNDANVICIGARLEYYSNEENVINVIDTFIKSIYEGGRHEKRLQKIREIEKNNI